MGLGGSCSDPSTSVAEEDSGGEIEVGMEGSWGRCVFKHTCMGRMGRCWVNGSRRHSSDITHRPVIKAQLSTQKLKKGIDRGRMAIFIMTA